MKNIIYYFTGTGNSLEVARQLQSLLPDAELVPIAGLVLKGDTISVPAGVKAGVVFPMYCGGLPNIVVRFFENANFSMASYLYTVITAGGKAGNPLQPIEELCSRSGHMVNSSWWIQMPDNYIPLEGALPREKQQAIFAVAKEKIAGIAKTVDMGGQVLEPESTGGKLMRVLAYKPFMKKLHEFDKKFTISKECNHCMICVQVCPVNNIISQDEAGIFWTHRCEACLACLQFCPKKAISCGNKTEKRERYHHPSVSAQDIMQQKILK